MSGYTKHMFEKELIKINNDLTKYINSFIPLLPYTYDFETIRSLLERYYPYEWFIINEKYKYYCIKEECLRRHGKKPRFQMDTPCKIVKKLSIFKKITDRVYIYQHQNKYNEEVREQYESHFTVQRNPKIKRIYDKIEKAKIKTQQVEPEFLDALMGLYDKKSTTQKDKVYIFVELQKYYCPKVINFFSKKVDIEYNPQLRRMAFEHLQSFGFQPILRRQKYMKIPSKNKKRREYLKNVYAKERYNIKAIPEELEYRIENSKEQMIKSYDFFISHSSVDYTAVQRLIQYLNEKKKNIYCDWINDNDYLKRKLVGKSTLSVIEKRLLQSRAIIFVISNNSLDSNWCKYELNYFNELGKPIYAIRREDILKENFNYYILQNKWFLDSGYRDLDLF
ncbi:toll/interleukin-1 receptor domain-containing protein [Clostridium perfringens]|uniref:toll/interleukin-1 receptor domain-containing protein n=2 Tax=Clostridium perfringens TaxID=1502 RepID=UPI0013E30497|nr:toll/interleukin-1 receptor domain-containing protein [Clostridium perfringens]NGT59130.1 toll/interleukin-1 receptor domain-containing protein [Clostridium perfringens]